MVIDTSAMIAVLQDEPERRRLTEAIEAADARLMSTASFVEASIVRHARHGRDGVRDLDLLISDAAVELVPVDSEQADAAREAFFRFGKGNHAAGLNFGDCFSYALARTRDQALLFKGADFSQTDIAAIDY